MIKKILPTLAMIFAVSIAAVAQPSRIEKATTLEPEPEPAVVVKEEPKPKLITCNGCTDTENKTLQFFHLTGVKDKNALGMIMGSIKQESRFLPAVCEGGFITTWEGCTRGGFGLIQFTSSHRYYGLGRYAASTGQHPESLNTQLEYILTEKEWKQASKIFKQMNLPMSRYDWAGYIWLGYGIKGNRLYYAFDYARRIA